MKRILVMMTIVIGTLFFGGISWAGDYHTGDTLQCSQCHVMHFSQSHGYNSDGTGAFTTLGAGGPYENLLRNEVNDLCLVCHDGDATRPDVLNANSGYTSVRQAGALNRGDASPYYYATGHTLDSTDMAPGGTWTPDATKGLMCTDCHSPHGDTLAGEQSYRNLWRDTGGGVIVTYAVALNDTDMDVYERSTAAADHYEYSNIDLNEPDTTESGFGKWCKDCHTEFHGVVGGTEIGGSVTEGDFHRHPTAGVNIGAIGGGHSSATLFRTGSRTGTPATKTNWVKVMSPTGDWYESASDAAIAGLTPTCISCHKGHGNQNAFGLIQMANTGTITEQGTSGGTYRNLCNQCHGMGL
jgi:hypothetical protein